MKKSLNCAAVVRSWLNWLIYYQARVSASDITCEKVTDPLADKSQGL